MAPIKKHSMEIEKSNANFQKRLEELQAEKDNLLARMHAEIWGKYFPKNAKIF